MHTAATVPPEPVIPEPPPLPPGITVRPYQWSDIEALVDAERDAYAHHWGVRLEAITIGQIVRLDPSTDGLFKSGEVKLDPRLDSVSEVTVLVPLQKE